MSYSLSFSPAPPSAPSPLIELFAFRIRIPSVWRWLARTWEKNLLEIKGFSQMVSEMTPDQAKNEIGHWEISYQLVEKYHDSLQRRVDDGTFTGKNILHFCTVVAAMKAEIAALITVLQFASKRHSRPSRPTGMAESIAEIGMRSIVELTIK